LTGDGFAVESGAVGAAGDLLAALNTKVRDEGGVDGTGAVGGWLLLV